MKMDFGKRGSGRKIIVTALGLALCANGCTYFAEQPEVYPDKFSPAESDRAWIPKSNEYVIPMQARPPSTIPEPRVYERGKSIRLARALSTSRSATIPTRGRRGN